MEGDGLKPQTSKANRPLNPAPQTFQLLYPSDNTKPWPPELGVTIIAELDALDAGDRIHDLRLNPRPETLC